MSAPRPIQRVGHIADHDNRFCGSSVFGELSERVEAPTDLLAIAFGAPKLDAAARDVLRCVALSTTSPDARVWPLKMTRVLASFGNPYAGFFGAQLGNFSDRMGPGTASVAAASLVWIASRIHKDSDQAAVAATVATHVAERGRIAGFGVPFRKQDERLVGLHRLLAGHVATRRPMWLLHERVIEIMRAEHGVEPNVVFPVSALFLDLGVAAHRAGMLLSMLMAQNFAAHALEASEQDGPYLRELPFETIEYRGRAPRPVRAAR
jgi:hypothetical protein